LQLTQGKVTRTTFATWNTYFAAPKFKIACIVWFLDDDDDEEEYMVGRLSP
jgi:hypothetical protein